MLKNEFFANISHEFRTPINVLLGIIQLMNTMKCESMSPESSEKVKRYFRIMKQNCYRLLRLTNNLIDMTKLDNGYFEVSLKNCNVVQIIEDITLSVASYIENKGICLTFDTDIEEKTMAVDPDKLERIMLNLLSNAVKFTEREGSIFVNVSDKDDGVEISVRDTGIGIPEDKLNVIFERFRQVNNILTREREGSGIGLSLTKNLVELLGGNIRVRSKQGEGSEFIVWLPYKYVEGEVIDKHELYKNQSQVERIHIEFSDIYSIQNSI
jgi:two-component system phosphate regulon sensor histidine kinase PhoR